MPDGYNMRGQRPPGPRPTEAAKTAGTQAARPPRPPGPPFWYWPRWWYRCPQNRCPYDDYNDNY